MATKMLKNNQINRPLKGWLVDYLAKAITSGDFVYNGESVIVSKDGYLLDGQHRLSAIVKTGIPCQIELIEGVNKKVMPTIDTGSGRSAADVFAMNGFKNCNVLAGVVKLIYYFNKKQLAITRSGSSKMHNTEAFEFLMNNLDIPEYIIKTNFPGLSGTEISFMNYVATNCDPDLGAEFIDKLNNGLGLSDGDPVLQCRNVLLKNKIESRHEKLSTIAKYMFLFKALNLTLASKTVKKMIVRPGSGIAYPSTYPFYGT